MLSFSSHQESYLRDRPSVNDIKRNLKTEGELFVAALPPPEEIGNNFFNLGGPGGLPPPGMGPPGTMGPPPRGMHPVVMMRGPPRPPPLGT